MDFVCTLASGSSGNAALFCHDGTRVLIDMGIPYGRLVEQMEPFGLHPCELTAVLVTHAHSDHVSGLTALCRKAGPPVLASRETAAALMGASPSLRPYLRLTAEDFTLGNIRVETFPTPHDAPGSQGYLLHMGDFRAAYATDMGHVPEEALRKMKQAHYLLLEANFDTDMLRYGPYPAILKRRIFGKSGHLSNDDSASAAVRCVQDGAQRVTLCHLSEDNNSPDLALGTVAHALYESGLSGFSLDVAPRFDTGEPLCFA